MKKLFYIIVFLSLASFNHIGLAQKIASKNYLDSLKKELRTRWPNNRTINLIFHGHSVPTGYMTRGVVDRLHSYPFLLLNEINTAYPYSVVNTITTSIGGENAQQGALRMKEDVFVHKPDVIFIDYALNDRPIGLEQAKEAWKTMIESALKYGTKVILLTPTPDLKEDILSENSPLAKHSKQIKELAAAYNVGLVDSHGFFRDLAKKEPLQAFMAQNNHINQKGHHLVAKLIFDTYFN